MTFAFLYYGIILFVTRVYENDNGKTSSCSFDYPPILENSIAEFFGITIVILLINQIGRVKSQSYGYLLGGIAVIIMGFNNKHKIMVTVFSGIARAAAMGASSATWVHTPELFPTNLRASGHSICNVAARLAAFSAPFIVFSSLSFFIVAMILFCANIVAAVCAILLPETAGLTLDDAVRTSRLSSTKSHYEAFHANVLNTRTLSDDISHTDGLLDSNNKDHDSSKL